MRYEILKNGRVADTIIADADFMAAHYATGSYREVAEPVQSTAMANNLITVYAFRSRFTADEKRAIYTAAKANVDIQIWLDDLGSVQGDIVDLALQDTINAVNNLEAVGLIATGRAAVILAI